METTWPSMERWTDIPETVGTRRAVYGKVHRAPTDYRWIGWSEGFGSRPPTRERELSVDTHGLSGASIGWRCAPATGPFAIRFYASRAFDAAGRPGGVEKQILAPFPETGTAPEARGAVPPVALAFLLLDAAAPFDDTLWWDTWRNPAWASMSHYLAIAEQDCPRLQIGQLDGKIQQGLSELLDGVEESRLIQFYSRLLAGTSPATLAANGALLSPLAMAALLLPLERARTEQLSIAGGVVAPAAEASKGAKWNQIVCTIDTAESQSTRDATQLVQLLKLGRAHGGHPPAPLSPGGSFLAGFLKSDGRWLVPGTLGTKALEKLGPWATVKSDREAANLRSLVTGLLDVLKHRSDPDEILHLRTKYELSQALLIVLCPGPESYEIFKTHGSERVPALYLISRIEREDWDDLALRYTREQFLDLASHSLHRTQTPPLAQQVRDFFMDQACRDQSSLLAQYATAALRAAAR